MNVYIIIFKDKFNNLENKIKIWQQEFLGRPNIIKNKFNFLQKFKNTYEVKIKTASLKINQSKIDIETLI